MQMRLAFRIIALTSSVLSSLGLKPVEIIVDGGVTRGRDIFKALALGAKAVMLGRPMIYGMGASVCFSYYDS